jgi:hypothetical protein
MGLQLFRRKVLCAAEFPPNLCEVFGLFSPRLQTNAVEKALTAVSEKASRGDTKLCSHKLSVSPKSAYLYLHG